MFERFLHRRNFLRSACASWALISFLLSSVLPGKVFAQPHNLPSIPSSFVAPLTSALMWGMRFSLENPFKFDFIIQKNGISERSDEFRDESEKIIKYFLTALTIPEDQLWVNLSPYENNRVVPSDLGQTQMGHDLLLEDYFLKQLTASLVDPETQLGKVFWDKVYRKAYEEFGTTNIPINTFNKVWILPKKASVYVSGSNVFITQSEFKVLLEKDYLAFQKNRETQGYLSVEDFYQTERSNDVTSKIVNEILIPEIENEVNHGKNFGQLRQIYHSLILAYWFKKNLKQSIVNQVYSDQKKISGVHLRNLDQIDQIYQSYIEAFKSGVCEKIKVSYDQNEKKFVSRKYFSGGSDLNISRVFTEDTDFRNQKALSDLASAGDLVKEQAEIIPSEKRSSASPLRSAKSFKAFFATMVLGVMLSLSTPYLSFASNDIQSLQNDPRLKTEQSVQSVVSDEIISRPGIIGVGDKELLQKFVTLDDIASLSGKVNPITKQTYKIDLNFFEKNLEKIMQSNIFGWGYETVVIAAQHKLGVAEDGDLGPQTRKALIEAIAAHSAPEGQQGAAGNPPPPGGSTIHQGSPRSQDTIAIANLQASDGLVINENSLETQDMVLADLQAQELAQEILDDSSYQNVVAVTLINSIADSAGIGVKQINDIVNPSIKEAVQEVLEESRQVSIQDSLFWEQMQPRIEVISDSIEFQDYLIRDIVQRISEAQNLEAINLILIPSMIPAETRILLERMRSVRQTYLKSLFDRATLPIVTNPPEKDSISIQALVSDTIEISRQIEMVLNDDRRPVEAPDIAMSDPGTGLPTTRREYFDRFDQQITTPTFQTSTQRDKTPIIRISPKVAQLYHMAIDTITLAPRRSYPINPLPYIESDTIVQAINDYQNAILETVSDSLSQGVRLSEESIKKIQEDTLNVILRDYPQIQDSLLNVNDSLPSRMKSWINKYFSFKNIELDGSFDWWQLPAPALANEQGEMFNKFVLNSRVHPFGRINPLYVSFLATTERSDPQLTGYYDAILGDYVYETDVDYDIRLRPRFGIEFRAIPFLDDASLDVGYQAKAAYAKMLYEREFPVKQNGLITVGVDGQVYWFFKQKKIPLFLSIPAELKIKNFIAEGGVNLLAIDGKTLFGFNAGIGYGNFYARYSKAFPLFDLSEEDRQNITDLGYFQLPQPHTLRLGMNFSDRLSGGAYFGFGNSLIEKNYGFELHALIGQGNKKFNFSRPFIPGIRDPRLTRIMDAIDVDIHLSPEYISGKTGDQKINIFNVPFSATSNVWEGLSVGIKGLSFSEKLSTFSRDGQSSNFQIFPTLAYDFSGLMMKKGWAPGDRFQAEAEVIGKALGLKAGYDLFDVHNKGRTFCFKADVDGQLWLVSLDGTKGFIPIMTLREEIEIRNNKFIFEEDIVVQDGIAWFGRVIYQRSGWEMFLDFPIFGGRLGQKDFMDHIENYDPFKWQFGTSIPLGGVNFDVSLIGQGRDKIGLPLPKSINGVRFKLQIPINKLNKISGNSSSISLANTIEKASNFAKQIHELSSHPDNNTNSYGGIDLSEDITSITTSGDEVKGLDGFLDLDWRQWENFQGFIPIIIDIIPITNFNLFLSGLSRDDAMS